MPDERGVIFRLAVQKRVEPHIADGVETLFPALLTGVVDALAEVFHFIGCQCPFDEEETVFFELV